MIEPYQAIGLVPTMWGIRQPRGHPPQPRASRPPRDRVDVAGRAGSARAPGGGPGGRAAGLQRRGARSRPRDLRARVRDRHPGPRDRRAGPPGAQVGRVRDGPGEGAPPRVPGAVLQRRLRPRPRRRGRAAPPQAGAAAAGGALGHAAQRLRPLGRALRRDARRVLSGRGHRDRAARDHDGQRGLLSRERARAGHERRGGRLPGLVPAPCERRLRGADAGARAGQQLLRHRAERRHLLPDAPTTTRRSTPSAGTR